MNRALLIELSLLAAATAVLAGLGVWFLLAILKKGVVPTRSVSFHRDQDPALYWICFLIYVAVELVLIYALAGVVIALLFPDFEL